MTDGSVRDHNAADIALRALQRCSKDGNPCAIPCPECLNNARLELNATQWTDEEIDDLVRWVERLEAGLQRHPEFAGMTYAKPFLTRLAEDEAMMAGNEPTDKCRVCHGTGVLEPIAAGMKAAEMIANMTPNERLAASSPCSICDGSGIAPQVDDGR